MTKVPVYILHSLLFTSEVRYALISKFISCILLPSATKFVVVFQVLQPEFTFRVPIEGFVCFSFLASSCPMDETETFLDGSICTRNSLLSTLSSNATSYDSSQNIPVNKFWVSIGTGKRSTSISLTCIDSTFTSSTNKPLMQSESTVDCLEFVFTFRMFDNGYVMDCFHNGLTWCASWILSPLSPACDNTSSNVKV